MPYFLRVNLCEFYRGGNRYYLTCSQGPRFYTTLALRVLWCREMRSFGLSSTLLPVCPDCGRLNFFSLNWCSNCGCLLVGSGIPPNNDSPPPYFTSQNFRQFGCTTSYSSYDYDKNQRFLMRGNQSSLLSLEQTVPSNRKSAPYISVKDVPYSLDASKGHVPLMSHAQTLANDSKGIPSYHLQFVPSIQPVFSGKFLRHSRHRCVSGPCDSVSNFNRNFQNQLWVNNFICSSFSSDPHIRDTVQLNCPYLFSVSPEFFVSCQGANAQPVYCHDTQAASQSISQLSEMLMGCSTVSQAFTIPSGQQSNGLPVNRHPHDMTYFNKRLGQNQRQVCGFRNRGSNKRNARNHADRTVNRCFLQSL